MILQLLISMKYVLLMVGIVGFCCVQLPALASSDEEAQAVSLYKAGRYSEASAGLLRLRNRGSLSLEGQYYYANCLAQMKQTMDAIDAYWTIYRKNPDSFVAPLCRQALSNCTWNAHLHLKNDQLQSFRAVGRDGKTVASGAFSFGPHGLKGEMRSDVDVEFNRLELKGDRTQINAQGITNEKEDKTIYSGKNTNIVVHRGNAWHTMNDEQYAEYEKAQKSERQRLDELNTQAETGLKTLDERRRELASRKRTSQNDLNAIFESEGAIMSDYKKRAQAIRPERAILFIVVSNEVAKDGSRDAFLTLSPNFRAR